jgi:hypothetical protein
VGVAGVGREELLYGSNKGVQLLATVPQPGEYSLLEIPCRGVKGTVRRFAEMGENIAYFFPRHLGHIDDFKSLIRSYVQIDFDGPVDHPKGSWENGLYRRSRMLYFESSSQKLCKNTIQTLEAQYQYPAFRSIAPPDSSCRLLNSASSMKCFLCEAALPTLDSVVY